jgi:hypothetical protein
MQPFVNSGTPTMRSVIKLTFTNGTQPKNLSQKKMAPEIAEAIRINREHDAEMARLYGDKSKKQP